MILAMKQISIQDLKASWSAAVAEAEAGQTILITRHNEPVAKLMPAEPHSVHRGHNVGTIEIKPAIKRGTKIPFLDVLLDDRGDR